MADVILKVEIEETELARSLAGAQGERLKIIERRSGAKLSQRGTTFSVTGEPAAAELAARSLRGLAGLMRAGYPVYPEDVDQAVKLLAQDATAKLEDVFLDTIYVSNRNRVIAPKGLGQKRYVDAIRKHDLVFGVGPAGTGKTYLAMAMAVSALAEKKVKRIVLARPAVEAGEKLGFLPGDLAEKVNPYLRPLHDALHDMMDLDKAQALVERGTIEVAPLAFMRGRTLNDAFIILDEAQNTTPEQMKMFLTRLGFGSKAVVTGDVTQVDLPSGKSSGLAEAMKILDGVPQIAVSHFTEVDVVRHPLVQAVVVAWEAWDQKKAAAAKVARGDATPEPGAK